VIAKQQPSQVVRATCNVRFEDGSRGVRHQYALVPEGFEWKVVERTMAPDGSPASEVWTSAPALQKGQRRISDLDLDYVEV
jgi:hypothetical protein